MNVRVLCMLDQAGNSRVVVPHCGGAYVNVAVVYMGVQVGNVCFLLEFFFMSRLRGVVFLNVLFRRGQGVGVNDERNNSRV